MYIDTVDKYLTRNKHPTVDSDLQGIKGSRIRAGLPMVENTTRGVSPSGTWGGRGGRVLGGWCFWLLSGHSGRVAPVTLMAHGLRQHRPEFGGRLPLPQPSEIKMAGVLAVCAICQ